MLFEVVLPGSVEQLDIRARALPSAVFSREQPLLLLLPMFAEMSVVSSSSSSSSSLSSSSNVRSCSGGGGSISISSSISDARSKYKWARDPLTCVSSFDVLI